MKRLLIGLGVAIAMTFAGSAWAQVPPDVPPGTGLMMPSRN
jgi:hypothetical protein